MTAQTTRPGAPRAARAGLVAALALAVGVTLALLAGPSRGDAATAASKGHATLALTGSAGKALRSRGVKASAKGGATLKKATATIPVSVAVISGGAAVGLKGTVTFKSGKRTATFTGLRLAVTKKRAIKVTATLAGKPVTFLTGKAPARGFELDGTYGTAAFAASTVTMPTSVAKKVRTRLKLKRTPAGTLGKLVLVAPPAVKPTTTTPTMPTATTPTTTTTTTTPTTTTTIPTAPFVEPESTLPRPATAVDVSGATITWHPRDSWIGYINVGQGTSVSSGATADAPMGGCTSTGGIETALVQRNFHYAFHRGWYDPIGGTGAVQFDGTVNFKYAAHTIDVDFKNPEIQLGIAPPQATFRLDGRLGTNPGNVRASVLDLTTATTGATVVPKPKACANDPGPDGSHDPAGTLTPGGGHTYVYERIPATLNAAGSQALQGYLPPDSIFGWITVSFSTAS